MTGARISRRRCASGAGAAGNWMWGDPLDEYLDWKSAYLPRILIDPVTGEEVDDPYTGHRLENVEREGARRAMLTMGWLNG